MAPPQPAHYLDVVTLRVDFQEDVRVFDIADNIIEDVVETLDSYRFRPLHPQLIREPRKAVLAWSQKRMKRRAGKNLHRLRARRRSQRQLMRSPLSVTPALGLEDVEVGLGWLERNDQPHVTKAAQHFGEATLVGTNIEDAVDLESGENPP